MGYCPVRAPKSSATFCCTAVSSSCQMLTSMPVRSLKGLRLAAIAEVGGVFSEMKLSDIPLNCFHSPPPIEACEDPDPPPHPANHGSEVPAIPAPAILRNSRLVIPLEGLMVFSDLYPVDAQLFSAPTFPPDCSPMAH